MFYGVSEDIACALIARNEVRKNGLSPGSNPGEFNNIFHDFLDEKRGVSEAERKRKITNYLDNSDLAIKRIQVTKDAETGAETQKMVVVGLRKE